MGLNKVMRGITSYLIIMIHIYYIIKNPGHIKRVTQRRERELLLFRFFLNLFEQRHFV